MRTRSASLARLFCASIAPMLLVASGASATAITTNSNLYLTPFGIYDSGVLEVPVSYSSSGVTLSRLEFGSPSYSISPPAVASLPALVSFSASISVDLLGLGSDLHPSAAAVARISANSRSGGGGDFDTEMLALDLAGLPGGALLRESPSRASIGYTVINDIGGGLFEVDSFFDIFTELSLNGGQTWYPGDRAARVSLIATPEPSSLALALLAGALTLIWRLLISCPLGPHPQANSRR